MILWAYLGKQTLAWAKSAPADPRVPEFLYIAVQALQLQLWVFRLDHDQEPKKMAVSILRTKYPQSPLTAKLLVSENQ